MKPIESSELRDMLRKVADHMYLSGTEKMNEKKIGISCFAKLDGTEVELKFTVDWDELEAYLEQFILAQVRYFFVWVMGFEIALDMDWKIITRFDKQRIQRGGIGPSIIGKLENQEWKFYWKGP